MPNNKKEEEAYCKGYDDRKEAEKEASERDIVSEMIHQIAHPSDFDPPKENEEDYREGWNDAKSGK